MGYTAGVITVSDKGYIGQREDTSGPALAKMLTEAGFDVVHTCIVPDEQEMIQAELIHCADELGLGLVLTTGGTGLAARDVTPEATKAVLDREIPAIPLAMVAESMKITPKACLSRMAAGARKETLIINLPGSRKGSTENLSAVLGALDHGVAMLHSEGSAGCGEEKKAPKEAEDPTKKTVIPLSKKESPSMDAWLKEAKQSPEAKRCGMFLTHNGVVRETAKALVRNGDETAKNVEGMEFSYDQGGVDAAIKAAYEMPGIYYIRVWLNEGRLDVGDDIMYVLVGGDIRPHVIDALQALVGQIKTQCVVEKEL